MPSQNIFPIQPTQLDKYIILAIHLFALKKKLYIVVIINVEMFINMISETNSIYEKVV